MKLICRPMLARRLLNYEHTSAGLRRYFEGQFAGRDAVTLKEVIKTMTTKRGLWSLSTTGDFDPDDSDTDQIAAMIKQGFTSGELVREEEGGVFDLPEGVCNKVLLSTIEEIKAAVDNGQTVHVDTDAYEVIKDDIGQYLIICEMNDYCIGLHGIAGTKFERVLNGSAFYVKQTNK